MINNYKVKVAVLVVFLAVTCLPLAVSAQNEKIEKTSLYEYEIDEFATSKNAAAKVITSSGVDYGQAYNVGWSTATEVFGLEGLSLSFLNDVMGVGAVSKIGDACGNMGMGLAVIQLGIDISQGKAGPGVVNFSKSSAFYAIGKFGWQSLKIAAIGVQFIDYALNKFGNASVAARVGVWNSAYRNYYERGPGRVTAVQWKGILNKAGSKEEMESIIRNHLKKFWGEADALSYATLQTAGPIAVAADPLPSEATAIENSYMADLLLPYLRSVFASMAIDAKKAQIKEIQAAYEKIVKELNATNQVRVVVIGAKDIIAGLPVKMAGDFMEAVTDGSGKCSFKFTVYSLLTHSIKSPADINVKVTIGGKEKEFSAKADLKQKVSTVQINVGGLADVKGVVSNEKDNSAIDAASVSISNKYKGKTNGSGEYLIRNVPAGQHTILVQKNGFEKKSVPLNIEAQEPSGGKNPEVVMDVKLKPLVPGVKIVSPKNGSLVETLRPVVVAMVQAGPEDVDRESISVDFDAAPVDFSYNGQTGEVKYTSPELKEDPATKCKHEVTVTVKIPGKEGKTISATSRFTAGVRPIVTELALCPEYLKEPDNYPLLTGQIYDEHSGPNPGSISAQLDGKPIRMDYAVLNEKWINVLYWPKPKVSGGTHRLVFNIKDNGGIPAKAHAISFKLPGPDLALVRPVNAGKVTAGDKFQLAIAVKNTGDAPAENVIAKLYCNDRQYATVTGALASFGNIDPAAQFTGSPLFTVEAKQNVGNPQTGEPVTAHFTLRMCQRANPKQVWEERFTILIYPGELAGGNVYVRLVHGTYMAGEWPVHVAYQRVMLTGSGGSFVATSDGNGLATFRNIPEGTYQTYVPTWYTYGAKLGEYIRSVVVVAGQDANAMLKGSCPYLHTWNGRRFEVDNDIYSTARILAKGENPVAYVPSKEEIQNMEYTDYLSIQNNLKPKGRYYAFRLEEIRNEISWTDFAKLMVIDHPKDSMVSSDGKGNVYSYRDPDSAVIVLDGDGNTVTELVGANDEMAFRAFHGSSVVLRFAQKEKIRNAQLVIRMKGWERVDGEYEPIQEGPPSVDFQVKDQDGQWQTCRSIFPRNEWDVSVVDMTPFLRDKEGAEIRVYTTQCRTDKYNLIDFIGLDTRKQDRLDIRVLDLKKAKHSFYGDVTAKLLNKDSVYVQTYPGETIDIYFDKLLPTKQKRSFIFISRGHYMYFSGDSIVRLKRDKK